MKHDRDFFTPETIDEQVEQIAQEASGAHLLPAEQLPRSFQVAESLVSDLQRHYHAEQVQDVASLERSWKRISSRVGGRQGQTHLTDKQPVTTDIQRFPSERTRPMQKNLSERPKQGRFFQSLSTLAAVLFIGLLVGGLLVVLNATHRGTQTGSRNVVVTQTATATPMPAIHFGHTVYTTPPDSMGFQGGLSWSPDSKRVVTYGVAHGVQIWDATTGAHKVTVSIPNSSIANVAWSPNSQLVALTTYTQIMLVDGQTGVVKHTYSAATARIDSSASGPYLSIMMPISSGVGYRAVSWSSDGRFLAVSVSAGPNGTIQILNVRTGVVASTLPIPGNYVAEEVIWSPDGKYIAASVFNTEPGNSTVPQDQLQMIWVWNAATHQVVFKHTGGNGVGESLAWQPASNRLAFVEWIAQKGGGLTTSLAIWDVPTNTQVKHYPVAASSTLAWSPDGKYIAYVGYSTPVVGSGNGTPTPKPGNVAPTPTPMVNSAVPNQVVIIDASSGQQVYVYKGHQQNISELAWSPDGKYIVSAEGQTSGDMVAKVWTA
ncbi:MAG: PD40 domain-containing protein [Ktedonobacteraceae bacterium]|nr:PD40 domain-containing protein [Ktedonobacteraceae bacterium]